MTDDEFDQAVGDALASLPEWVNDTIDNLIFAIADRPNPDQDPHDDGLLGLYEGVSLLDRGNDYSAVMPDTITIFKEPHVALGLGPEALRQEIRVTVLHEIAHHLGMDEQRLHELGWD
jgi:predicted Zn-dependent protease with MMP-like domain